MITVVLTAMDNNTHDVIDGAITLLFSAFCLWLLFRN